MNSNTKQTQLKIKLTSKYPNHTQPNQINTMETQQKDCAVCKKEATEENPLKTIRNFYQRDPPCNHFCKCSTLYCFECSVRNHQQVFPKMACHVCKKHFGIFLTDPIQKTEDRLAHPMNRGVYFWLQNLTMKIITEQLLRFMRHQNAPLNPPEPMIFQADEFRYLWLTHVVQKLECVNSVHKREVLNLSLKEFTNKWIMLVPVNPVALVRTKVIDEKVNGYVQNLTNTFDDVDEDEVMVINNIIYGVQGMEGTLYDSLHSSNFPNGEDGNNEDNKDNEKEEDEENEEEEEEEEEEDANNDHTHSHEGLNNEINPVHPIQINQASTQS